MKPRIDLRRAVIVNIDVQDAFGKHASSPALQGLRDSEDREVRAAASLSKAVYEAGGTVVVTKDWHNAPGTVLADGTIDERATEEFAIYGRHAQAGSKDAQLNRPLETAVSQLEEKAGQRRTIVGVDRFDPSRPGASRIVEVHKNTYDVTKRMDLDGQMRPNQSFIDVLVAAKQRGAKSVILTGKIAEVCVKAAIESIRELFPTMRIIVADDAVSSMPASKAQALSLPSKEDVLSSARTHGVHVVETSSLLPSARFAADGVLGR